MNDFEVITSYKNKNINLPMRSTDGSAGYDIEAAEDIVIPSFFIELFKNYDVFHRSQITVPLTLDVLKDKIKNSTLRTVISTGLKIKLDPDKYLAIHPRSSVGGNALLVLANQTGIIDSDYYDNEDNEGHIILVAINLSPFDIQIKKGDKIAQGIITEFYKTDSDIMDGLIRTGGFGSTDEGTKLKASPDLSSISAKDYYDQNVIITAHNSNE